jgi:hypothetical protein
MATTETRVDQGYAFQREQLVQTAEEVYPLLEKHWEYIAHYKDIELNPDWEVYFGAEAKGMLRCYSVRHDQAMVGYAVFFVKANAHYRQSLQALQDILWIDPAHRSPTLGVRFINWCDEQLRQDGVQVVYHHVKLSHNFGPVLKYLGYEPIEEVWGRRLDSDKGGE